MAWCLQGHKLRSSLQAALNGMFGDESYWSRLSSWVKARNGSCPLVVQDSLEGFGGREHFFFISLRMVVAERAVGILGDMGSSRRALAGDENHLEFFGVAT